MAGCAQVHGRSVCGPDEVGGRKMPGSLDGGRRKGCDTADAVIGPAGNFETMRPRERVCRRGSHERPRIDALTGFGRMHGIAPPRHVFATRGPLC